MSLKTLFVSFYFYSQLVNLHNIIAGCNDATVKCVSQELPKERYFIITGNEGIILIIPKYSTQLH